MEIFKYMIDLSQNNIHHRVWKLELYFKNEVVNDIFA
jgi:hypothetical protein